MKNIQGIKCDYYVKFGIKDIDVTTRNIIEIKFYCQKEQFVKLYSLVMNLKSSNLFLKSTCYRYIFRFKTLYFWQGTGK